MEGYKSSFFVLQNIFKLNLLAFIFKLGEASNQLVEKLSFQFFCMQVWWTNYHQTELPYYHQRRGKKKFGFRWGYMAKRYVREELS